MPDAGARQRWRLGALYPAGRWQGKVLKALLRVWVAVGLGATRTSADASWEIGTFVDGAVPNARTGVAWIGPPGPSQKATLELSDETGRVVAYVKYAETNLGRRRLQAERAALIALPEGVGPSVLHYGPLLEGEALCISPVQGHHVPSSANPPCGLVDVFESMRSGESLPASEHPWLRRIASNSSVDIAPWIATLGGRDWDVVRMHGDLAPWNVLIADGGAVRLVDWEHASESGFPLVDMAYWVLQVGCLVRRSSPSRTFRKAVRHILALEGGSIGLVEAQSIVRLAALMAYEHASEDGHGAASRAQVWRRTVWECDIA